MKNRIAIETKILTDADAVAQEAAKVIAAEARAAVAARRRFVMAVSGGHTPWQMLRALAHETVPWESVHVVQVDERIAPAGAPDRNLTQLRESLLEHAPLPAMQVYAMPVEKRMLKVRPRDTPTPFSRLPERRRCSISRISDSARTATRRRSFRMTHY